MNNLLEFLMTEMPFLQLLRGEGWMGLQPPKKGGTKLPEARFGGRPNLGAPEKSGPRNQQECSRGQQPVLRWFKEQEEMSRR